MIISDEELQQDVQGAGEHAVRNGHGNPQEPALEHIHGGLLVALGKVIQETESADGAGGRCYKPGLESLGGGGGKGLDFTHRGDAAGRRKGRTQKATFVRINLHSASLNSKVRSEGVKRTLQSFLLSYQLLFSVASSENTHKLTHFCVSFHSLIITSRRLHL